MTTSLDNDISEVQESVGAIQLNAEEKKKNKKARQKASKKERPATLVTLPTKVLVIVASMVRQHSGLGSLASLNVCSKALYTISLPLLWKEVVWKTNMWKNAQDRTEGDPPGWKFIEYIYFSGKAPWFWKGLVATLPEEEVKMGCQDIVHLRWPKLRAVVRTEALINVEIPKAVWLTIQGAHHNQSSTDSPVAKVVEMAYKAWKIANLSPAVIPKFVSHYQPDVDSYRHAIEYSGPREKKRRVIPDAYTRPPTTLQHFQLDTPDATLQVDMVFVKQSLDFYILSDTIMDDVDQVCRLRRLISIWKVFYQVQRHFALSKLEFAMERCWIFDDVALWLEMAELAAEGKLKRSIPFEVTVILGVPHTTQGFLSEVFRLQDDLRNRVKLQGLTKIEVTDMGHPARPPPVCVHAKIDLQSVETSKVVLISQCFPGGCDHMGYRDRQRMTPSELASWKSGMQPKSKRGRNGYYGKNDLTAQVVEVD